MFLSSLKRIKLVCKSFNDNTNQNKKTNLYYKLVKPFKLYLLADLSITNHKLYWLSSTTLKNLCIKI